MKHLNIKSKIIMITIIPLLITACLLSLSFITKRLADTEQNLSEKGNMIAEYLASASEYGVLSGNTGMLRTLLQNTLSIPEVATITIRDNNDNILVQLLPDTTKRTHYSIYNNKVMMFARPIKRTYINIDDSQEVSSTPPKDTIENNIIGSVSVTLTRNNIILTQQKILLDGILITIFSVLITLILVYYFSRSISNPILLLTNGILNIGRGILGEHINTNSGGEIAILEKGINDMSDSLQKSRIDEHNRAKDELFIEKTKAQITLDSIGEGVISTDINGNITYINQAAANLLGTSLENIEGQHLDQVFNVRNFITKRPLKYPLLKCLIHGDFIQHDNPLILCSNNNFEFVIRDTATPLRTRSGDIIGMVLVFHDCTHIQNISEQLKYQASHDELTGLYNRREFETQLSNITSNKNNDMTDYSLCYIDLDQFKIINDTCGHAAGDKVLKETARIIHENIRNNDILARLGGDEFGIIFKNCPFEKSRQIAENIKDAIKKSRFTWEQHVFEIGASIGMVSILEADITLSDLMIQADTACYVAKDKGRNRIHVYDREDEHLLKRTGELHWLQRINIALEQNNFILYCQKIVPTNNFHRLQHHEILIRMTDNEGNIILPENFLPPAEHYRLTPGIDRWVFTNFMTLIKSSGFYSGSDQPQHTFSINLSGQSICHDGFLDFIISSIETSSIDPAMITFEVTETAAIENYNVASEFIRSLKEIGCKFALDDFGNGLSSFRYLKELPVDYLKIDGNFIRGIKYNSVNQSIISSITTIAKAMKLETIAEFVEDEETLKALLNFDIDFVQGNAIEMPVPLTSILNRK